MQPTSVAIHFVRSCMRMQRRDTRACQGLSLSVMLFSVILFVLCAVRPASAQSGHGHAAHPRAARPDSTSDSAFAALQQRGKVEMGVDQYTSTHRFDDLAAGESSPRARRPTAPECAPSASTSPPSPGRSLRATLRLHSRYTPARCRGRRPWRRSAMRFATSSGHCPVVARCASHPGIPRPSKRYTPSWRFSEAITARAGSTGDGMRLPDGGGGVELSGT